MRDTTCNLPALIFHQWGVPFAGSFVCLWLVCVWHSKEAKKGGREYLWVLCSQGHILVLSAVAYDMSYSSLRNSVVVSYCSQMLKSGAASWYVKSCTDAYFGLWDQEG